ncbi:MAG: response regulator transcription factor [Saprospiraceae bacterium]
MTSLKVVLADAHSLFLDGFREILINQGAHRLEILGTANSSVELISLLRKMTPDLLMMELNLTDDNGLSILPNIKKEFPDLKICIVSGYTDHKFVKEAFTKGADGYYSKYNDLDEIEDCITDVMGGRRFLTSGLNITPKKNSFSTGIPKNRLEDRFLLQRKLTKREYEVLELITRAMNNKEIAEELYISDQTVGVHRKNIMRKLGVRNTVNLIKFAIDNQLV